MLVPVGVLALTWTTTTKVDEAPAASVAEVPVIVPVPPTAGLVTVKVGPLLCVSDTKVVFVGMLSVSTAFGAAAGPTLLTVIVYVRLLPAVTGLGVSVMVTFRSDTGTTVIVTW